MIIQSQITTFQAQQSILTYFTSIPIFILLLVIYFVLKLGIKRK